MNKNIKWPQLLGDIRFWIFFFFIIRLIGITDAPLESAHNWRQSLTNMIARNFYEGNTTFFYPMIDMAGEKSGIIGSEFPLFNYLIYLLAEVFGYQHWYGRLINLVVSSLGVYYFYLGIKELLNKKVAFYSAIALLSSIWFMFSRKSMPDTFSVSLMIIGLYYALNFLKYGGKWSLILFGILSCLGILCKIPALSLLSVLELIFVVPTVPVKRKVSIAVIASLSVIISFLWYFKWVPYLLSTYQFQLYFPKTLSEGIHEIIPLFPDALERFYFSSFHSFIAFAVFLVGFILLIRKRQRLWLLSFLWLLIVFCLFILKTGAVFAQHSYYIIPFVPVMAVIVGFALSELPKKLTIVLTVLLVVEGVGNQYHDFFIKDSERYKLSLEGFLDDNISRDVKIIVNDGLSPQMMYFAHHKGWSVDSGILNNTDSIQSIAASGAEFLVVDRVYYPQSISGFKLVDSTSYYSLYYIK